MPDNPFTKALHYWGYFWKTVWRGMQVKMHLSEKRVFACRNFMAQVFLNKRDKS
jgi:hypothetical protein